MLSTSPEPIAETHRIPSSSAVRSPPVTDAIPSATSSSAPGLLERADHHEQPDQEEQRQPLDRGDRAVQRLARDEQHHRRARQRDRRRLQVQRLVDEEHEDRQHQDRHRPPASAASSIDFAASSPITRSRASGAIRKRERNAKYSPGITTTSAIATIGARLRDERAERQPGVAGDQDVRRVADQRRGAAEVRRDDLDHDQRHRVDVERVRQQERDRDDQQDRRHVVQERRQHRGRDRQRRARPPAAGRARAARHGSPATCRRPWSR